ncbi:MAG: ATP synthase subunit I [Gammaproteobacteria bacterium]|nr:ATP synthase subunit I [Gammaproteobacteria bacterium]
MMQRDALHAFSPPGPRESVAAIGRLLLWQTLAGLFFAAAIYLMSDGIAGASALIGAALCLIPNLFFAMRVFPGLYAGSARRMVRGLYTAEALKFAVTVLLFIAVFRFVAPLRPDMLFIGFLLTQFSMIFAAWMTD